MTFVHCDHPCSYHCIRYTIGYLDHDPFYGGDVIREAKGGYHTTPVQQGILIGFLLFAS